MPRDHMRSWTCPDCPVGEPALAEVAASLLTLLAQHAVAPFDEIRRTGLLRYVVLRANAEGKVLVALVTGRESWPQGEALARELAAACPAVLGVVHNINSTGGNALFGEQEHLLFGSATIEDTIGPARVRLGRVRRQPEEAAGEARPQARHVADEETQGLQRPRCRNGIAIDTAGGACGDVKFDACGGGGGTGAGCERRRRACAARHSRSGRRPLLGDGV